MGVTVSNWRLARSVAQLGQLGVISGTLLAVVFARRLQAGDIGGHMADAMVHFPLPTIAERIRENYFIPGGKAAEAPFKPVPMPATVSATIHSTATRAMPRPPAPGVLLRRIIRPPW